MTGIIDTTNLSCAAMPSWRNMIAAQWDSSPMPLWSKARRSWEQALRVVKKRCENSGCFDFGDGGGAVPAHRHINPDGSIGGWVADTATVMETAWIDVQACVYGHAHVGHFAHIEGTSEAFGRAYVNDCACLFNNASISGEMVVLGGGRIFSRHPILGRESYADLRVAPPQRSENRRLRSGYP